MPKTLFLFLAIVASTITVSAQTITGTVHNKTTGQPAAGDDVVLLRLGQGMQEESRAKSDAQGNFTLNLTSPSDEHVIQVFHQGVSYNQRTSGSGSVEINVYDAVAKIDGLRGPMGFVELEADDKTLKVAELYTVNNTSNPPATQARPDNFEITVPANGVFESVQAKSGQGMWLKVKPDPVKGQSGKYTINFPIRPGETQLVVTYNQPYRGSAVLRLGVPYPIEQFGVMHAPSMTFKALRPDTFRSGAVTSSIVGEGVRISPVVGSVPEFQISGVGRIAAHGTEGATARPPVGSAPQVGSPPPPTVSAPSNGAHPAPVNPPTPADQSKKELWLMIGGIATILLLGGFTLWRMKATPSPAIVGAQPGSGKLVLDALKEELFQLESDRLHGSISDEEYASTKQALTKSIERATAKKG